MRSGSMSRRRFDVLAGAAALIPAIRPALAGAQTPAASPATAGNLLAVISFEAATVPTMFGDVTVTQNPQCAITLTDGALDPALAIGVVPVGATASSNGESAASYPEYSAKVPGDLTYVGGWGELDIEQIVALAPDLILGDRYLNFADHTLYDTLSRIAIVVASEEIQVADASSLQQWEYEQLVWSHALGKDQESLDALTELRARAGGLQVGLGDNLGARVVVFRPQPEFAVIMTQHWITGVMLM